MSCRAVTLWQPHKNEIKRIIEMKKSILTAVLLSFGLMLTAQTKKVAILETVDKVGNVPYGVCLQLRSNLTYAISNTPGYEGYDRVDMSSIMGEHNFQRTGMVSDEQIRRLGEMTGASSILVAEAAVYDPTHIIITAKILNVETAGVESAVPPQIASTTPTEMQNACVQLAAQLIGGSGGTYTPVRPNLPQNNGANMITINVGNVSFEMVKVEAGSFIMGCTSEQGNCDSDERPYHRVTISSDYYMGKFEVTQELYEAVMGVNPSNFKGFDRPVEMVRWNDAQEFCAELSRMTGRRFRLPTEAEWEYAARGGKKSTSAKFSGSSSVANVAWYTDNSGGQTHPVGKLRPNELGLYDMSGNVWEWCQDWYGSYGSNTQTDPQGPSSGQRRVLRGGSWFGKASNCRVANRNGNSPDYRYNSNGFRVVLVP